MPPKSRKGLRILLSNDDGVHALGLLALQKELEKWGNVTVVAPLEERSTTGHSLTIHKPLRLIEIEKNRYGVSGSPADCVYLGVRQVMKGLPDLVVSGINRGANLGQDVYYSGTVSAAREACILGIPSIAVSLAVDFFRPILHEESLHYDAAAQALSSVLSDLPPERFPEHTLFNLNVPDQPLKRIKGIRITRMGFRFYNGSVLRRKDHRGRDYYWVGGQYQGFRKDVGTDCHAVSEGYASLTPIKLDATDLRSLGALQALQGGKLHR